VQPAAFDAALQPITVSHATFCASVRTTKPGGFLGLTNVLVIGHILCQIRLRTSRAEITMSRMGNRLIAASTM